MPEPPFTVLYVCTGNVCRSPMAELLLRAWSDPAADLMVSSAGTQALVGEGIDRSSAVALSQLSIDPARHRARQFEPWMATCSDLILTASREHRDVVMTDAPSAYKRTFTMKEFARLVSGAPREGPHDVIAAAAAGRGIALAVPEDDDVRDPYRAAITHARTIAEEITATVYVTLDALGFAAQRRTPDRPMREDGAARPTP